MTISNNSDKSLNGYNVQTAVDTKHHLIVAHDVINDGHDRDQLSSMCGQARDAIGATTLTAFADRGYFKGEEILECERAGIRTMVPKPQTSGNKAAGLFDKVIFATSLRRTNIVAPRASAPSGRDHTVHDPLSSRA